MDKEKYSTLTDKAFEKIEEFSTVKEFENHILILLEIGRNQLGENMVNSYFYDYTAILKALRYPVTIQNPAPYKSKEEYKRFC